MTLIKSPGRIVVTPTGSWTTNATYTGSYRHDKQAKLLDLDFNVALSGAPNAVALSFDLPASLLIDYTRILTPANRTNIGGAILLESGNAWFYGFVCVASPSQVIQVCYPSVTGSLLRTDGVTEIAPFTFGASDVVSAHVRGLPVQ